MASASPAAFPASWASNRARCSSGSTSSVKALHSSRPATIPSKRSTQPGRSRWSRDNGETSFG